MLDLFGKARKNKIFYLICKTKRNEIKRKVSKKKKWTKRKVKLHKN